MGQVKIMKKTGVSQKAVIFNREGKILALRRSKTHPFHPFFWDLPGGDVEFGEDPLKGIIRETKEETGLRIKNIQVFDVESHFIGENDFWLTIAYKAEAISEKVRLSYEHDDFCWVSPKDFLKLKSSKKLRRFVRKLDDNDKQYENFA